MGIAKSAVKKIDLPNKPIVIQKMTSPECPICCEKFDRSTHTAVECKKCSCFVTSIYSEILIRDKHFNIVRNNNTGFIQLFSLLPISYPGHSILTEDIGEIVDDDNCECSSQGTRFLVHGRAKQSEIRGCSDT